MWLLITVVAAAVTLSDVFALPVTDVIDATIVASFLTQTTLGTMFLIQMASAALVAVLAPLAARRWQAGALLAVALIGIGMRGTTGHAGITGDHEAASILLGVHVAAVSVWVGGLVVLVAVVLGRVTPEVEAFRSFSAIALWSVTAVAVTGVAQLLLRVADINELYTSAYGLIMVAKVQLLAVLIAIGWLQRSRALPMMAAGNRRPLAVLAGTEAVIMAAVVGLSVTLSRTPTASHVAGDHSHALPPVPLDPLNFLAQWRVDAMALILAAFLTAAYAEGLYALRRRGDAWPRARTASFGLGLAALVLTCCSGIGTYSLVLSFATFVHAAALLLVIPTLLILGRPLSLLEAAAGQGPAQGEGVRWLIRLRHVAVERAAANAGIPVVVALSVVIAVMGTGVLPNLLWPFWGRLAMDVVFLLVGTWACAVVIQVAEGPGRARLLPAAALAAGLMGIVGVLMALPTVFDAEYYGYFLPAYADDLLAGQRLGAGSCMVIILGWFVVVALATRQRPGPRNPDPLTTVASCSDAVADRG